MKQTVKLGNPESNVAICTLWTPIEIVERQLSEKDYAIIGQLYSKDAGLNTILRYCLENKKIRHIIICGLDRTQSGQALLNLKEKGIDTEKKVIGVKGAKVDDEIPAAAVERFRSNVDVIDARNKDYSSIKPLISSLEKKDSYGKPESYPQAKIQIPLNFPTDPVFKVRSETVAEAWLQALQLTMKFGKLKESQHDEKQKEVICLVSIITKEDPDNVSWAPYLTFSKEELEEYYPQVLTDPGITELSYTYGQRLRNLKGKDQLKELTKKLKEAPHTRRAIAFTWDVELDTDSKNPPCLNLVQALIQDSKLYLIAYLRSNDIYAAWPKNVFALRKLQKNIATDLKKEMGELIVISASAHIYERHFRQANEILKEYPLDKNIHLELPRSTGNLDPRGNIHVKISDGKIVMTHLSANGERLEEHTCSTAAEASRWLVLEQKISDISHALYLGQELTKAETAIKKGLKYEQDMPI